MHAHQRALSHAHLKAGTYVICSWLLHLGRKGNRPGSSIKRGVTPALRQPKFVSDAQTLAAPVHDGIGSAHGSDEHPAGSEQPADPFYHQGRS